MSRPVCARLLLAILLLPLAPCLHAAPRWRILQAPHATILSQLPEDESRKWASEFEQFTAAALGLLVVDEKVLSPLTIVLFEKGQFDRYKPLDSEKHVRSEVAGLFGCGVIALGNTSDRYQTRHILFHETTHWLLTGSRTEVPLWLHEGLAEAFATFEPGVPYGVLGLSCCGHVDRLQTNSWLPWEQILQATREDPIYRDDDKAVMFYAEAWLFAHQLLFDDPTGGAAPLDRHTRARLHGANPQKAFATAIEKDFARVESRLQNYVRNVRFTPRRLRCPPEAAVNGPYLRADSLLVEASQAKIAIAARRYEVAEAHIRRLRALGPNRPEPFELLAVYEDRRDNLSAAIGAAREAIRLGSASNQARIVLADDELDRQLADGHDDKTRRRLAEPYRLIVVDDPRHETAYNGFARVVARLSAPTEEDAQLLLTGRQFFPDNAWPFVGLAAVAAKKGDQPEALRLLKLALTRGEIDDRTRLERARDSTVVSAATEAVGHIEASIRDGRSAEAIEGFEKLMAIRVPRK